MGNSQGKEEMEISPYVKQIVEARQNLTGWQRLKFIVSRDEYGALSPEVQRVLTATMLGTVIGGLIGAMGRGRIAYQNFFRSNLHEAFHTPLEARRKLQDSVTIGMGYGAARIAWRIGLFTGMYMTVSTAVSAYRGKMGILDQVIGAGVAGFLYKFPQGPKASVSGGLVGSCLGLSAGLITLGLTKITGQTIDQANMHFYHYLAKKEEKETASVRATRKTLQAIDPVTEQGQREFTELSRFHDKLLAGLDPHKDELQSIPEEISSQSENSSGSNTSPVSGLNSQTSSVINIVNPKEVVSKLESAVNKT